MQRVSIANHACPWGFIILPGTNLKYSTFLHQPFLLLLACFVITCFSADNPDAKKNLREVLHILVDELANRWNIAWRTKDDKIREKLVGSNQSETNAEAAMKMDSHTPPVVEMIKNMK